MQPKRTADVQVIEMKRPRDRRVPSVPLWLAAVASACDAAPPASSPVHEPDRIAAVAPAVAVRAAADTIPAAATSHVRPASNAVDATAVQRPANELGRIPILEYHLFGETEGRWQRTPARFREDLELLYERGYRPVTIRDLVAKRLDLPAGLSPVVITFDDASPGQFRYVARGDSLVIDAGSAVGVWLDMNRRHPDWENRGVFCMLSGAEAGRAFFGDKGIEGQETAWRHRKVKALAELGFELCNHTLWHANLKGMAGPRVQEQIARLQLAIDSVVPGYEPRTFALPLGQWPDDRSLAVRGGWTDPKSGRAVRYEHDAVLLVAGGPARSPHDPEFDALRLPRVQVFEDELRTVLDQLDRRGQRYVSDGDPTKVTKPAVVRPSADGDGV
jgi:peptidoglycan/xylan/chitin deacetylase (PgdA/CDA1 family)